MEQPKTPIEDIDLIAALFRDTLKEFARDFVVLPIATGGSLRETAQYYIETIKASEEYEMWRTHAKGILDRLMPASFGVWITRLPYVISVFDLHTKCPYVTLPSVM